MKALDIFAGAGGFSEGAQKAGVKVVFAVNHWDLACWTLRKNHGATKVRQEDVFEFDWNTVPDVDLVLASPACQSHSTAATAGLKEGRRGTAPKHDRLRATAWSVPLCLEVKRPAFCIVENVAEFMDWAGYRAWRINIEDLGYHVAEHVVDCATFGLPSRRKRLFVSAVRDDVSPVPFDFDIPDKDPVPFGSCLTKKLTPGRERWIPFSKKTEGVQKLMLKARKKLPRGMFLLHNSTRTRPIPLSEPCRTITTQSGQWNVVRRGRREDEIRPFTVEEYLCAMGFPKRYKLPKNKSDCIKLIGNAVPPPVSKELVGQIVRRG